MIEVDPFLRLGSEQHNDFFPKSCERYCMVCTFDAIRRSPIIRKTNQSHKDCVTPRPLLGSNRAFIQPHSDALFSVKMSHYTTWLYLVSLLCLSLISQLLAQSVKAPESASVPSRLWSNSPAAIWNDSYLIGNGRIGAAVRGGAASEVMSVNEDSWSGSKLSRINPDAIVYAGIAIPYQTRPDTRSWNACRVFLGWNSCFGTSLRTAKRPGAVHEP